MEKENLKHEKNSSTKSYFNVLIANGETSHSCQISISG
jgi:hypothetical protein